MCLLCIYSRAFQRALHFFFLGWEAHAWANLPATPDLQRMRCFMQQRPALKAAFVQACQHVRAEPDLDPEIV